MQPPMGGMGMQPGMTRGMGGTGMY